MITTMKDTTASQIAAALLKARRQAGSPAMGMVLTLVVVASDRDHDKVMTATRQASREHPCRILLVLCGRRDATPGLDAQVEIGDGMPGETVTLRLNGAAADQPETIVLPLLLPDSPVVVWWPSTGPDDPSTDRVGALGARRITDAEANTSAMKRYLELARHLSPGDTDLAWTRLTSWRALLAAALDQHPASIVHASVHSARQNAHAALMAGWLESCLGVEVDLVAADGPGINEVRLTTAAGDIRVTRTSDTTAEYVVPGQPLRTVSLKRRTSSELLTEELRRMDHDEVYDRSARALVERHDRGVKWVTAERAGRITRAEAARRAGEQASSTRPVKKAKKKAATSSGTTAKKHS